MYKNEIKQELQSIYFSNKKIEDELAKIKTSINNLKKLNCKTEKLEKMLDKIKIEFYNFKIENNEILKNWDL